MADGQEHGAARGRWRAYLGPIAALLLVAASPAPARAAEWATVFIYHRFGEGAFPSTNIRLDQFEAHLAELAQGGYAVLPVADIIARIRARESLPERAVGITVDDAYRSFYREAWPRLRRAGFPVTLFVATDQVGGGAEMMSWDEIREVRGQGVAIGAHTAAHPHMPDLTEAEARDELERSRRRFVAELGEAPALFAYPYGEYALALKPIVAASGHDTAFGQHSGVVHPGADFFYLPRFALNETYGDLGRFRLAARALPLPVTDVTPADPLVRAGANPPAMGFTVAAGIERLDGLACYATSEGRTEIERLGERRFEVRFARPFPSGRARVNCTAPGPDGRWRWFGMQFYVTRR
jgi:peptidoglycan/xylan/chitin deacetylase (PgdA/CDA1 family)